MELSTNQIVYGILTLIVILTLVVGGIFFFQSDAKTFIDNAISSIFSNETKTVTDTQSQKIIDEFIKNYKTCKEIDDDECLCDLKPLNLPEGYALTINNYQGDTRFALIKFQLKGDKIFRTQREAPKWTLLNINDQIVKANFKLNSDFVIDNKFKFTPEYLQELNLILEPLEVDPTYYSNTHIYTEQEDFNLQKIYKKGIQMVLIPSRDISKLPISLREPKQAEYERESQYMINKLRKLRICKQGGQDVPKAKQELTRLHTEISNCLGYFIDLKKGPDFTFDDAECLWEDIYLKEDYKIILTENTMNLYHKDTLIDQKKKSIYNKKFTINPQGFCSFPDNTAHPDETTTKIYTDSIELTHGSFSMYTTKVANQQSETCYVKYNEDHSLRAN